MFDIVRIGEVCREFRVDNLKLSLTEFSKLNDENLQNIHAFEKGRANNIKYLFMYMKLSDVYQIEILFNNLFYDVIK